MASVWPFQFISSEVNIGRNSPPTLENKQCIFRFNSVVNMLRASVRCPRGAQQGARSCSHVWSIIAAIMSRVGSNDSTVCVWVCHHSQRRRPLCFGGERTTPTKHLTWRTSEHPCTLPLLTCLRRGPLWSFLSLPRLSTIGFVDLYE